MLGNNVVEEWRAIKGYEGFYEVSDLGRVRSLPRVVRGYANSERRLKLKVLAAAVGNCGYRQVNLHMEGIESKLLVHRLVAETFIRPMHAGEECNHLDFNRLNNDASNLEITSRSGNRQHSAKAGRLGKKLDEAAVIRIRRQYAAGESQTQIALAHGVNQTLISAVLLGRTWRHVGTELSA